MLLGAVLVLLSTQSNPAGADPVGNTNAVETWCPDGGVKYDNLSDPTFIVPAPPAGTTWTKAIVKAGREQYRLRRRQ